MERGLSDVIQRFLRRSLLIPLLVLAVLGTCGLVAWRIVQLKDEHRLISWSVDGYVSNFLGAADENLSLLAAVSGLIDAAAKKDVPVGVPLPYHRVFFIQPDRSTVAVYGRGMNWMTAGERATVSPPPTSYFSSTGYWPNYSVPYFRSDLNSVTVATMMPTRWGTVVGELDLGHVHRLIQAYFRKVPHRIIWIMDRYGNLIVHPDVRKVQEQENMAHEPLIARALAHPEGTTLLGSLSGTTVYGMSWRIEPWGWVILVAYPLGSAIYPIVMAAFCGFTLFFAFLRLVVWGLMRRLRKGVVGPVESLTRVVQRLAEGRGDAEEAWPQVQETFAELGIFAQRFREMSRAVQEREEALLLRQKALVSVQESLARSERRYREILESIDEAYFELDTQGVVTFHNSAFVRLFGLDPPPAHPFSLADMAGAETAEAMEAFFRDVAEGRSTGQLQVLAFHDVHGSAKTVEISAQPMHGDDKKVVGIRVMARDITARIEAEKKAKELERIVSHAQKMESLGTLASGIAHEFNNLLQAMTGYVELLARHTEADDRKRRWIVRVQEATDRGAELVRRMLTFARQDDANPEVVDINRLVHETLAFLRQNIPRRIYLEENLSENLPAVYADRLQLEQLLINLVVNARDAIGEDAEGSIRVTTAKATFLDGTQGVVLTVSDTGRGIPEAIQERIFDPFFTTKEPGKGTGLGLSTVYGVVKRLGGTVTFHSRPGQGTAFFVTLPVHASRTTDQAMVTAPSKASRPSKPADLNEIARTVLVVDDEKDILEHISEGLADEGFHVLTASSGEEALAVLQREAGGVHALILDENMPGMGGTACLTQVRRLYPTLPVILTSGEHSGLVSQQRAPSEHVAFLPKPYRLRDLMELLCGFGVA
ncbi:PAS domain S-box-containing protein [Desulfosoma caldarium]|uniref:histidine kinase n=2 Tax=Desulfosoma caldarium TaxID=610254 RepID=A0A3N1VNA9_9BACT|nr:PAS domain S-box-containing protein [Desulfosoma caldarium]